MVDNNPYAPPQAASEGGTIEGQAVLRVHRTKSYADRLRAYRIVIDGNEVARIKAEETIDIPVNAGNRSVVAKIDWCGSPTLDLAIRESETISLVCESNLKGSRIFLGFLYVFFRRNRYLTLRRA